MNTLALDVLSRDQQTRVNEGGAASPTGTRSSSKEPVARPLTTFRGKQRVGPINRSKIVSSQTNPFGARSEFTPRYKDHTDHRAKFTNDGLRSLTLFLRPRAFRPRARVTQPLCRPGQERGRRGRSVTAWQGGRIKLTFY